jgi:hypothetical protein
MLRIDWKGEVKDSSHDCNRGQHPASNNGGGLFITMMDDEGSNT